MLDGSISLEVEVPARRTFREQLRMVVSKVPFML